MIEEVEMIKRSKGKFGLVVLLTLMLVIGSILGACAPGATPPPAEKPPAEKVVVIGNLTTLTGPAPIIRHPAAANSAYFKWLDEEGGIEYKDPKTGKMERVGVNYQWVDCAYSPPKAVTTFKRFVDAGAIVVLACSSGFNASLKPSYEKAKVPCVSYGVAAEGAFPPGWIFFTKPTYADSFASFLDYIKETWDKPVPPKLGFLTWDNPYGRGAQTDETYSYAKELGIELLPPEYFEPMPTDTTAQLLRLKDEGADYIYSNTIPAPISVVLKDAKRLGLDKIQFCGCMDTASADLMKLAGDAAEGYLNSWTYAFAEETHLPGVAHYMEVMTKYAPKDIELTVALEGWSEALVATEAIRMALEENGYPISGADVKVALERMTNFDVGGVCQPISYSPNERRGLRHQRITTVKGGKLIPLTDWCELPDMAPKS